MTAEMSAHAMAMQGRHGKIDFTLLGRPAPGAFYDLIMKNGTTTSSRNAAISPYSRDIARILLGNIHGRADAPHPLWLAAPAR
jgi:hypothetical protein